MYGIKMLTKLFFLLMVNGKPLIWHTDPDPSWVMVGGNPSGLAFLMHVRLMKCV